MSKKGKEPDSSAKFGFGCEVEAKFLVDEDVEFFKAWFPCKVIFHDEAFDTYTIIWEDEDGEVVVPSQFVRLPAPDKVMPISAFSAGQEVSGYREGFWYSARVVDVGEKKKQIKVQWDDFPEETTLKLDEVRVLAGTNKKSDKSKNNNNNSNNSNNNNNNNKTTKSANEKNNSKNNKNNKNKDSDDEMEWDFEPASAEPSQEKTREANSPNEDDEPNAEKRKKRQKAKAPSPTKKNWVSEGKSGPGKQKKLDNFFDIPAKKVGQTRLDTFFDNENGKEQRSGKEKRKGEDRVVRRGNSDSDEMSDSLEVSVQDEEVSESEEKRSKNGDKRSENGGDTEEDTVLEEKLARKYTRSEKSKSPEKQAANSEADDFVEEEERVQKKRDNEKKKERKKKVKRRESKLSFSSSDDSDFEAEEDEESEYSEESEKENRKAKRRSNGKEQKEKGKKRESEESSDEQEKTNERKKRSNRRETLELWTDESEEEEQSKKKRTNGKTQKNSDKMELDEDEEESEKEEKKKVNGKTKHAEKKKEKNQRMNGKSGNKGKKKQEEEEEEEESEEEKKESKKRKREETDKPKKDPAKANGSKGIEEKHSSDGNYFSAFYETDHGSEVDSDDSKTPNTNEGGKSRGGKKIANTGKKMKNWKQHNPKHLKEMSDPQEMFTDMVKKQPKLNNFAAKLKRPLRLATVCSGTEAPILAMDMICKAIKEVYDQTIEFEHVFSCEIEPFKQAYIERNFAPPILFRDVRELGNGEEATTAYGARVKIPGDVDIMIAGTSCVDYSAKNTKKKKLVDMGESGQTFLGLYLWVEKHKPKVIIIENICKAPWDLMQAFLESLGYTAGYMKIDTKKHYVPQTRNRKYLMATLKEGSEITDKWQKIVKELERPSTSVLEAFLLPTDDPEVNNSRRSLVENPASKAGTPWIKCEGRHRYERATELLGDRRPMTNWSENGTVLLPDFAWTDWAKTQTDRVMDLMEINYLFFAQAGQDVNYKASIWDLSQNVDRSTFSKDIGISTCLTPGIIGYLTNRGGILTGRELLALQGIPAEDLQFTRETEDQLANLAGNAMTCSVVGAVMIGALLVNHDFFDTAKTNTSEANTYKRIQKITPKIVHDTCLKQMPFNLECKVPQGVSLKNPILELNSQARLALRKCACEGQYISLSNILECTECGHTACAKCAGKPEHNYTQYAQVRTYPRVFGNILKNALPTIVRVKGFSEAKISGLVSNKTKTLAEWIKVVSSLNEAEFKFRKLERTAVWRATYISAHAKLELELDDVLPPTWYISATGYYDSLDLTDIFSRPIARMQLNAETLPSDQPWEIYVPVKKTFKVVVERTGDLVDSWEAQLGLLGDFKGKKRTNQVKITAPDDLKAHIGEDVSGIYDLKEKCGTAMSALHVKRSTKGKKIYFFLDPHRCKEASADSFVFAYTHRRTEYREHRTILTALDPDWRPSDKREPKSVECTVNGKWVAVKGTSLAEIAITDAVVDQPTKPLKLTIGPDECLKASVLIHCQVPVTEAENAWPEEWHTVELNKSHSIFETLTWIVQKLHIPPCVSDWVDMTGDATTRCLRCAPQTAKIRWVIPKIVRNSIVMRGCEDPSDAAKVERAFKVRPDAFVVQLRSTDNMGEVKICVNPCAMAHRALALLPVIDGKITMKWRVVEHANEPVEGFAPLKIKSNKKDKEHAGPPNFSKYKLRHEQLRSLSWMLQQELSQEHFLEEDVVEVPLNQLGWRLECKVTHEKLVHGGILADQVGYGKTAIILGLIDTAPQIVPESSKGRIGVKATLVIVPSHLTTQWTNEVRKFLGKTYVVITIEGAEDLRKLTIADIEKADIIICSKTVYQEETGSSGAVPKSNPAYFVPFAYVTGSPKYPAKVDRQFESLYRESVEKLETYVEQMKNDYDPTTLLEKIQEDNAILAKNEEELANTAARNKEKEAKTLVHLKKQIEVAIAKVEENKKSKSKKKKKKDDDSDEEDSDEEKEEGEEGEANEEEEEEEKKVGPAAKKPKIEATAGDVWNLKKAPSDWKNIKFPFLEMFTFARLVVDELTYVDASARVSILHGIKSNSRWFLSGTTPHEKFNDIHGLASLMGVHLGIEEGNVRDASQTSTERFFLFREAHTKDWHERRHKSAQAFLDRFVRQNIAEVDEIPSEEKVRKVNLTPAEYALYMELEHHLLSADMKIKKTIKTSKKKDGDKEKKIRDLLLHCNTPEEALLVRCSHYHLEGNTKSAEEACEKLIKTRKDQMKDSIQELVHNIAVAKRMYRKICAKDPEYISEEEVYWVKWKRYEQTLDDAEATKIMRTALRKGLKETKVKDTDLPKEFSLVSKPKTEMSKWKLREMVHELRSLQKVLTARVRSLRFIKGVRDLQKQSSPIKCEAKKCGRENIPVEEQAIFSTCGHFGCMKCVKHKAAKEKCIFNWCRGSRSGNIITAVELGANKTHDAGGEFGTKINSIVKLIEKIPKEDGILVFVQFSSLMEKMREALVMAGVPTLVLDSTGKAKTLTKMQNRDEKYNKDDPRVLILNMSDESASGANLTTCNHAIFVHALFSDSLQKYVASETQAVGRIRRYGQNKKCYIHRFLSHGTIDTQIYEARVEAINKKT